MRTKPSTYLAIALPVVLAIVYVGVVLKPFHHASVPAVQITTADSAELWDRCNSLYRQGKYQDVLVDLSKLLEAYPGNHMYLEMAAQVYDQLGDYQREAEYWEKYFDHAPNPVTACPQIGQVYRKQGKQKEALDAFERCLAQDPANADSIFYLAHALEMAGQTDRASELYARGLKLAPDYTDLQIGLARVQLRQGKLKDARANIMPTLSRTPVNVDGLLVAGLVLRREGDLLGAKQYLERGVQMSDGYLDIHLALAEIAEQEKNYPEAIRQYDRVLLSQPQNQEIRSKRDALQVHQ
jgi:tetratricopeptide (TPR) repeat protein